MNLWARIGCGVFASLTIAGCLGAPASSPNAASVKEGSRLFALNCAHCHGADATGDEGPDLHGVTKSDARITDMIQHGVKGEMPKFERKLSGKDIQSLIAFIRSLKE